MDSSTKRLFVGGLYNNIAESELRDRFSKFGDVDNIEIKTKKNSDGVPEKTFAYLDVNITEENLKKCFSVLNRSRWKGSELKIQHAKADFMQRLKEERENNFEKAAKTKNKKVVFQDPLDGVTGVENFHMKGAVPGTPVGAEDQNWVVGKYGRVLPIINIRRRDKRKIMKVDPSKFCHNSKRMKEDNMEVSDTGIQNLTWSIDTKDSEMIKRRKGEFPTWKQKKKKRNSDADMKLLADYYESFTKSGSRPEKTDFEVVPEKFLKVSQKKTYFSEENDSSDDGVETFKTSTPFPSPFTQSQQKVTVDTRKDPSVKGKVGNTGKIAMLDETKCTPIVKQVGKGPGNREDKALTNSKSSSPSKKTLTQESKQTSVPSTIPSTNSSQNTVPTEFVPDAHTSNSKKSKARAKVDQLLNQSNSTLNSKEDFSNDSLNKFSNKKTDRSDVNNRSKPKLQAFGGTRRLYDNPSSDCQQKVDSASPAITSASVPNQPHSEAMTGVKRTLFQNSMLKTPSEKEKEIQQDSDEESVSSADTDIIITSAKKQRGGGTVMGYGSLETPVSLQTSFKNSISEYGGGLVDGEAFGQASWMEQHDYELDDSDDSNDFEKVAKKILKNHKVTNNFAADKGMKNKDGEIKEKKVPSPELENSKESDSEDSSDDDNNNDTTGDSDDDDESDSSIEDMQCDDKDSGNSEEEEESDEEDSGSEEKSGDESSDQNSGEEGDEEDSGKESSDESTSSEDENTEVNKAIEENTEVSKEISVMKDVSKEAGKNTKKDKIDPQERTEKSTVDKKENKGKTKDKVDQEMLSKEANRKKKEALRLKQEEYNNRKSIIKQALSVVDNTKRSNRIVFDSDSDDAAARKSTANTSATQKSDKKAWDLQESDDGDESEDDSSEEEEGSAEEKDEEIKSGGTVTADKKEKKEKKSLFDESSSDGGDDDEEAFENKPQFEGEAGSQLMKLQMKFSSDSRFKLDQRFAESDEEKDDGGDVEDVEDEKIRNLKVLQEVVGVPVTMVTDKKDKMKKLFKDISALQYDPSREDHKNFEIQPTPDQKKDRKKKKSKKQKADDEEMEKAEALPVVSSEKFYEVTSALEDAFKKPDDNDSNTGPGAFSLLAAFGRKSEDNEEVEEMQEETTVPTPKWQGFNLRNSSDDDDLGNDSDEERDAEGGQDSKKEEEKPVFAAKSKDSFFFTEDDERIKEGIASFCRQEDLEKIRERWQERRPDLIKAYHAKYKRAMRNKRALEKTKTPSRRK
ncbi:nucleolar protein 8-like isoform X2 [Pecten maximus]|uniref:nucleolar protein 8-like isoform X2 n=1 Tax=Pecten maximus TaxID=6579 RepID=UPI001458008F|nr:nucleolar protein 8-like isoform X2 [Pecten maximus]